MMNKKDITFLTESTLFFNDATDSLNKYGHALDEDFEKLNEDDSIAIIQLRNNSFVKSAITNENSEYRIAKAINDCNGKTVEVDTLASMAAVVSNILGESISVSELFKISDTLDEGVKVSGVDTALVNKFVEECERTRDICKTCLTESDMFDRESLKTYLPKLLKIDL